MKTYSPKQAKNNFITLFQKVKKEKTIVTIGNESKAEVVLVSAETFNLKKNKPLKGRDSFDFLANEPDIYSLDDLKKRYV